MRKIRSKKLNKAVDDFVLEMKTRLAQREAKGFSGWNSPTDVTMRQLIERATEKLDDMESLETQQAAIDIANFMMIVSRLDYISWLESRLEKAEKEREEFARVILKKPIIRVAEDEDADSDEWNECIYCDARWDVDKKFVHAVHCSVLTAEKTLKEGK